MIGVTETWLNDSSAQSVNIDDYESISKCRQNGFHGGGVGLYVLNNQDCKSRSDLEIIGIDLAETLFIEIRKSCGRNIVVSVIYRPPDRNLDLFLQQFNELMSKISQENKMCYIMGDFNLDLMNHQSSSQTGEFLDSIYSNMFHPLISRPTRITSYTATLIDNIFTDNFHNLTTSGLLFNDLSDHLQIIKKKVKLNMEELINHGYLKGF